MMFKTLTFSLFVVAAVAASNNSFAADVWSETELPPKVVAGLTSAQIAPDDVSVVVWDANQPQQQPIVNWRAQVPRNPASTMKLVTTYAGLDILGPNHHWQTPVYINGSIDGAVLNGDLIIQGNGDPFLVIEHLWKVLNKVQNLGIKHIDGNIILDQTAFQIAAVNPDEFDGAGHRPYNVRPQALLLNFKTIGINFTPILNAAETDNQYAHISYDVPLDGVYKQSKIALDFDSKCGNWREKIQPNVKQPNSITFAGSYPLDCGSMNWNLAYSEPEQYASRLIGGLWKQVGGSLSGKVISGRTPDDLEPLFYADTQSLSQVIRGINKYSNNVMAQQLFLSLPLASKQRLTTDYQAARELVSQWWSKKFPTSYLPRLDNGSGLSRTETITGEGLALMLADAYQSPYMPELMASLPSLGIDGTLRSKKIGVNGHLKTGSLRNVSALAGYVSAAKGQRYILVAIVNSANAGNSQAVFDELLRWTAQQNTTKKNN